MNVLGSTSDFPTGDLAKGLGIPRDLTLKDSRIWLQSFHKMMKQKHLEGTNKTLCAQGPREKETWPTRDWARPACDFVGALWMWGLAAACSGDKGTGRSGPGRHMLAWALLEGPLVSSGQTANRETAQTHPSAENWIKGLLSMALPTRARSDCPRILQLVQASYAPPSEGRKRSKNYNPTASRMKITTTES